MFYIIDTMSPLQKEVTVVEDLTCEFVKAEVLTLRVRRVVAVEVDVVPVRLFELEAHSDLVVLL